MISINVRKLQVLFRIYATHTAVEVACVLSTFGCFTLNLKTQKTCISCMCFWTSAPHCFSYALKYKHACCTHIQLFASFYLVELTFEQLKIWFSTVPSILNEPGNFAHPDPRAGIEHKFVGNYKTWQHWLFSRSQHRPAHAIKKIEVSEW